MVRTHSDMFFERKTRLMVLKLALREACEV